MSARLACVSLPAFPLQVLLRHHPEWKGYPAAVAEEDRPRARLVWVNDEAHRAGVFPGLAYATALALLPTLRVGVVTLQEVGREVEAVAEGLYRHSPRVERADPPGTFWLDASGLELLHPSLEGWAASLRGELARAGWEATVVVGFSRFGTYAVARACRGVKVFSSPEEEYTAAGRVRLWELELDPEGVEALEKLGVRTVQDLRALPEVGLRERFGHPVAEVRRLATASVFDPLRPKVQREELVRQVVLDAPESDLVRLVFAIKNTLDPLLQTLARRGEAASAVELSLQQQNGRLMVTEVRPATPTLDSSQLADLVRLRLSSLPWEAGVVEARVRVWGTRAGPEQLRAVPVARRDPEEAARALARLRAEFGDGSVVRAVLRDGHLPEARYGWVPTDRVRPPRRLVASEPILVRRVYRKPVPLDALPAHRAAFGPEEVAGGWWVRRVHRSYYFLETEAGELLWVYYDHRRRRWFLQGRVE
ncbi:MAG: DNA polymerase Y family protein [Armatimonadota bacterium]|nr:DNA polymerase Y family protein [Armatimonadota bacterium]MDR7476841.1 DNA polymerase Y family protein [Armatimonadota bacterium]